MSACEFVGSNVDFYVPLVLKRADLFLAADLFLDGSHCSHSSLVERPFLHLLPSSIQYSKSS